MDRRTRKSGGPLAGKGEKDPETLARLMKDQKIRHLLKRLTTEKRSPKPLVISKNAHQRQGSYDLADIRKGNVVLVM